MGWEAAWRAREDEKKEEKMEDEESAVWMVGRLKHNFNPFTYFYLLAFLS